MLLGLTMRHSGISMAGGIFYNIALGEFWLVMPLGPGLFAAQPHVVPPMPKRHVRVQEPVAENG